jgi:hypothetical protein
MAAEERLSGIVALVILLHPCRCASRFCPISVGPTLSVPRVSFLAVETRVVSLFQRKDL